MDFRKEALKEAAKSKCNKRKVGAVIVRNNEIRSRGHNHIPNGSIDVEGLQSCEDSNGRTKSEVIHAEITAINKLSGEPKDFKSDIYVTHTPCDNCQKAIDKAGLNVILVENFMKFDAGKLRYNLIPPKANKELAKVLTYGAKKYKPGNWKLVEDTERYIDALYRHLEAWRSGESVDPESKLSHLSHAYTNIAFLIEFEKISDDNLSQASI